ncbi:MAG: hypothetical protein GY724_26240 [Actinomycetia bacterium]|nr:hypothetical protein [Actinomycetes bacterium]
MGFVEGERGVEINGDGGPLPRFALTIEPGPGNEALLQAAHQLIWPWAPA